MRRTLARRVDIIRRDRRGELGIYETYLALMVVTAGLVLLSGAISVLAIDHDDDALDRQAQDIIDSILEDEEIVRGPHIVDQRALMVADLATHIDHEGGVRIMLTLTNGTTTVLFERSTPDPNQRVSSSEPVSISQPHGVVAAGLLTVWVWP